MRAIGWLTGVAVMAGMAAAGSAQSSSVAQVDALRACGTIAKKSARLACYDAMSEAGISASPAPAAAPATSTPMAAAPAYTAPAAAAPARSFGADALPTDRRVARSREAKSIEAAVVAISDTGIGHYLITLEGGAQWQVTETQSNFQPPRPGEIVRVRRGALGSYRMDVGRQGAVPVARVG